MRARRRAWVERAGRGMNRRATHASECAPRGGWLQRLADGVQHARQRRRGRTRPGCGGAPRGRPPRRPPSPQPRGHEPDAPVLVGALDRLVELGWRPPRRCSSWISASWSLGAAAHGWIAPPPARHRPPCEVAVGGGLLAGAELGVAAGDAPATHARRPRPPRRRRARGAAPRGRARTAGRAPGRPAPPPRPPPGTKAPGISQVHSTAAAASPRRARPGRRGQGHLLPARPSRAHSRDDHRPEEAEQEQQPRHPQLGRDLDEERVRVAHGVVERAVLRPPGLVARGPHPVERGALEGRPAGVPELVAAGALGAREVAGGESARTRARGSAAPSAGPALQRVHGHQAARQDERGGDGHPHRTRGAPDRSTRGSSRARSVRRRPRPRASAAASRGPRCRSPPRRSARR